MAEATPPREPGPRLAAAIRWTVDLVDLGQRFLWPPVDLALRLWLAYVLLTADMVQPLGALFAVLLAVGLLVQPAAMLALVLGMIVGVSSIADAGHVVLLLWLMVVGAAELSLDSAFARGLRRAALPGIDRLLDACSRLARSGTPPMLVVLRLLAALTLAILAWGPDNALAAFLLGGPAFAAPGPLGGAAAGLAALLLLVGLAVRPVGLAAFLVMAASGFSMPALALILALLAVRGGGPFALGYTLARRIEARFPHLFIAPSWADESLPHVVIVGAGFGGIAAAQGLRHTPCRVTLIDRRNYHLFQPLLYQVATASLSPADIAVPIRSIFRRQPNVRVIMGRVEEVDTEAREVRTAERRFPYDHLIVATGARHSYFGNEEWEPLAPGLKKIDDATDIRRRILLAFERAEDANDADERAAWLTFVVTGGGPTGVEVAGALVELAHYGMAGEFRHCDPAEARVILVEGGPAVLGPFPEHLRDYARRALERLGVEVWTDARVEHVDDEGVVAGGERIPARTVIWAAGVIASPACRWLGAEHDRAGRVKVASDLSVPGRPEIFVIGDTALAEAWDGKPVPGLAPAAKQEGGHVARVLHARMVGRPAPPPFRYEHQGNLATIGRKAAVVDLGRIRLKGAPAWWFWGLVHILFLIGGRNRVSVALEWLWAYLTFRRSTRLITGHEG